MRYESLHLRHALDLASIWSDVDVIRYTNIKEPCSNDEIIHRIELLQVFDVFVVYNNQELIGIIGCPCINKLLYEYGIFYQFKKSSWGKGYGEEAATWLLNYMKHKYPQMTLFADVVADNIASEKILLKLGFSVVEEIPMGFERDGEVMPIHHLRYLFP
ncbi:MAG: GNAT family N-acetyltransferase [Cellulosilyticaceae bacterium]